MTDTSKPRCFFFGCWNEPGHYLFYPGGATVPYTAEDRISWFKKPLFPGQLIAERAHLDGTLAPRRSHEGKLVWCALRPGRAVEYYSVECPQGQYLVHHLPNGFTAMSWWDRCQGDQRGACNSTVLLEGQHHEAEMLAALHEHFPHVVENLQKAGVVLTAAKETA